MAETRTEREKLVDRARAIKTVLDEDPALCDLATNEIEAVLAAADLLSEEGEPDGWVPTLDGAPLWRHAARTKVAAHKKRLRLRNGEHLELAPVYTCPGPVVREVEPVAWEAESTSGAWVTLNTEGAAREQAATAPYATGRVRALHPGPVQEASGE